MDQYRRAFNKPDLIAQALSGNTSAYIAGAREIGKTVLNAGIAPPQVAVSAPSSVRSAAVNISASVDGGSQSIQYMTVYVNGRITARDLGVTEMLIIDFKPVIQFNALAEGQTNKKKINFNLDIPLEPGDNIVEVIAFNGFSEGRAVITVTRQR